MTRSTRFALLAGATLAALTVAGCQQDDAVSGPLSARTAHPSPAGGAPASPSALPAKPPADDNAGALQFTDSWGHVYRAVYNADGSSTHTMDGTAYAQVVPLAGGNNVQYLGSGGFVMQQFMATSAPAGLPAVGGPRRPQEPGEGRPMAQQLIPCADQINLYILASGTLVAAGARLQVSKTPLSITAFAGAVAAWFLAWNNLYECEKTFQSSNSAPVTPR